MVARGTAQRPPALDARVRVAEDTRDFDLIGVTLPTQPNTPVLVRTADDAGVWGEWHELEFEDEPAAAPVPGVEVPPEAEEGKPGAHSSPYWVGDATRYELDLAFNFPFAMEPWSSGVNPRETHPGQ